MADEGMVVLDGTELRDLDLRLPVPDGPVAGAMALQLAESEASTRLFGLSLPENIRSTALRTIREADDPDFLSEVFHDSDALRSLIQKFLLVVADQLKDDPLVVSVLDGNALRIVLDDEDDFAMLAENLFTDLDAHDNGKLSKNDISNALLHMGVQLGVPPIRESTDLLPNIIKKHGAEGEEKLGQSQFADLLQTILQDLADALSKKNVIVIRNVKVINGSKLKKTLENQKLFNEVLEKLFLEWKTYTNGQEDKELRGFLEAKGLEFGLPSSESSEAVALLYDQIFSEIDKDKITGDLERDAFQVIVKDILEKIAQQLEEDPIFIDLEC
ncbi:EF-hand-containing protein [Dioscorea alata]|uniref:EF-hand-containing protein n=1 Tax=Dioscorea alata TaxID=55571 RepID=A0ACB7TVW6_DIOAL|nr:EF-hand-containing protein [Dioscorea alata]